VSTRRKQFHFQFVGIVFCATKKFAPKLSVSETTHRDPFRASSGGDELVVLIDRSIDSGEKKERQTD
jgi:hypothetical protein